MAKIRELWNMKEEELESQMSELRKELIKANSQVASGSAPKNPGQIRFNKKTIARINTILHKKRSGGNQKG